MNTAFIDLTTAFKILKITMYIVNHVMILTEINNI